MKLQLVRLNSYLHDLEGLDLAGVLNVRASAEIDQGTATVDGALLSGDQLLNVVQLVFAVREHLPEVLFRDLQSVKALLLLEDFGGLVVQRLPVSFLDDTAVDEVSFARSDRFAIAMRVD